jgi:hypothetical protein
VKAIGSPFARVADTEVLAEQKRLEREAREALLAARREELAAVEAARRRENGRRRVEERARIAAAESARLVIEVASAQQADNAAAAQRAWAALYGAARAGDLAAAAVLLQGGGGMAGAVPVSVDAVGGKIGRTALHAACSAGQAEMVRLLVEDHGAALDPADRSAGRLIPKFLREGVG